MRSPQFRLLFLIEVVAGLALGFAGIRLASNEPGVQSILADPFFVSRWTAFVNPFVASLSVAGLLVILWERLAHRSDSPLWGIGRVTWAATGAFVLAHAGRDLLREWIRTNSTPGAKVDLKVWLSNWLVHGTSGAITSLVIAIWITYAVLRIRSPVAADSREWSGRIFGIAIVSWSTSLHVLWYANVRGWIR